MSVIMTITVENKIYYYYYYLWENTEQTTVRSWQSQQKNRNIRINVNEALQLNWTRISWNHYIWISMRQHRADHSTLLTEPTKNRKIRINVNEALQLTCYGEGRDSGAVTMAPLLWVQYSLLMDLETFIVTYKTGFFVFTL